MVKHSQKPGKLDQKRKSKNHSKKYGELDQEKRLRTPTGKRIRIKKSKGMSVCNPHDKLAKPCMRCFAGFPLFCRGLVDAPCFGCYRGIPHRCQEKAKEQKRAEEKAAAADDRKAKEETVAAEKKATEEAIERIAATEKTRNEDAHIVPSHGLASGDVKHTVFSPLVAECKKDAKESVEIVRTPHDSPREPALSALPIIGQDKFESWEENEQGETDEHDLTDVKRSKLKPLGEVADKTKTSPLANLIKLTESGNKIPDLKPLQEDFVECPNDNEKNEDQVVEMMEKAMVIGMTPEDKGRIKARSQQQYENVSSILTRKPEFFINKEDAEAERNEIKNETWKTSEKPNDPHETEKEKNVDNTHENDLDAIKRESLDFSVPPPRLVQRQQGLVFESWLPKRETNDNDVPERWKKYRQTKYVKQQRVDDGAWRDGPEKEVWINDKLKGNLRNILSHHPDGLPAHQLCREYEKHQGVDLDIRYWGCQSVTEFCAQLPEVITIIRGGSNDPNGEWILYSTASNESGFSYSETHYESHEDSITTTHTPYKPVSGCESEDSRQSKLHDTSNPVSPPSDTVKTMSGNITYVDSIKLVEKPANVFGPGDNIPLQELPSNIKLGDFLDVLVAEVTSPRKFWVQLKGKDTSGALDSLMEEMEELYDTSSQEYKMPDDQIEVGTTCVSPHEDGYFYRVFVTSFEDLTTVGAFFIDYGNVFKIKKDALLYLHTNFAKLPAQAFAARLDGIKPTEGRRIFPIGASKRFHQLVRETEDMGVVAVLRGVGESLSLWLVDTCSNDLPQGIAINQVLVDEGWATADIIANTKQLVDVTSEQMEEVSLGASNSNNQRLSNQVNPNVGNGKDFKGTKLSNSVNLGGYECHIVIKSGSTWMTSQEISRFIPNWKGKDILAKMLSLKRICIPSLNVTLANDPPLHSSLKTSLNDEDCQEIVLYPLKSIPSILNVFLQNPGTQLRVDLQFQIENFKRMNENLFLLSDIPNPSCEESSK